MPSPEGDFKTPEGRQVHWEVYDAYLYDGKRVPPSRVTMKTLDRMDCRYARIHVTVKGGGESFWYTHWGPKIDKSMIQEVLDYYVDELRYGLK